MGECSHLKRRHSDALLTNVLVLNGDAAFEVDAVRNVAAVFD
jgi:hypothetical protein